MEDAYELAFSIILYAGNSRSSNIQAVKCAENGEFDKAKNLMHEADEELKKAHDVQTKLLQSEAGGEKHEINLIMIHAQDHLAMALSQKEVTSQFYNLYKRLEGKL